MTITYLTFGPTGKELLVNLGGEQVYLFNTRDDSEGVLFKMSNLKDKCLDPEEKCRKNETNPLYTTDMTPKSENLKKQADEYFSKDEFSQAIRLYNEAIKLSPFSPSLYSNRAAALMKRTWNGDMYSGLKDCIKALTLDKTQRKVHYQMARILFNLGWRKESEEWLDSFRKKYETGPLIESLQKDIESKDKAKKTKRSEDELGKLDKQEVIWRSKATDFENRYCGHCNTTTDIKEANFWGPNGQFVMAGSDDAKIFIWDRKSENQVLALSGDDSIVNCLQPHPFTCLLASSGIDSVVKLWGPIGENETNKFLVKDTDKVADENQKRMNSDPIETMLLSMSRSIRYLERQDSDDDQRGHLPCRPS